MALAIQAAVAVLNYFKNYPKEDVPPQEIWHHNERLDEWFAAVEERRKHPEMERVPQDEPEPDERNLYVDEILNRR